MMGRIDHRQRKHRDPRAWADKRLLIIDTARRLFTHDGYHETSLEDICTAIGYTKPFLYYHFESKEHLLLALVEGAEDIDAACRWLGVGGKVIRRVRALAFEEQSA